MAEVGAPVILSLGIAGYFSVMQPTAGAVSAGGATCRMWATRASLVEQPSTAPPGWFWDLIGEASGSRDRLCEALRLRSKADVRLFQEAFIELAGALTCRPYSDFVEQSEDGLSDVAEWVVSQGRSTYFTVLAHPESIPRSVEGQGHLILSGVAPLLYEERFGEPLDVY